MNFQVTFQELVDFCRAEAISSKLNPDELTLWRRICRAYSEKFHTPLHQVLELDPELVLMNYYESQMDGIDEEDNIEGILETIYSMEDPNYTKEKEEELQNFIEDIEEEERQRVKDGVSLVKHLTAKTKKPIPKMQDLVKEPQPTQGHIDLSYLESEEISAPYREDEEG